MCAECKCDVSEQVIFCPSCGKVLDREALKSMRFKGFTGRFSLKPNIEASYELGIPPG